MSRLDPRICTSAAALLTLALAAAPALAQGEPLRTWTDPNASDFDQKEEDRSEIWERTLHPQQEVYGPKVASAARLLQHQDKQRREEAEDLLRKAIEIRPDLPTAYWLLGHLYALESNWAQCAEARGAVFEIDPEYVPRNDDLVDHHPRGAPALLDFGLARCHALAGNYERAIEHYKRVITGDQAIGSYRVHWRLGEAYAALGRLRQAIAALKTAARLHPREVLIEYALAVAYDRDEQLSRSRRHLSTALARDSHLSHLAGSDFQPSPTEDEWYYQGLANKARKPERPEWALIYFRRFLAAHGNGPWVRRARQHVEELGEMPLSSSRLAQEGPARVDRDKAADAIDRVDAELQRCVRSVPGALLRVRVTMVAKQAPTRRTRDKKAEPSLTRITSISSPYRPTPKPGVRTSVDYSFDTNANDIAVATHCLDNVAYAIAMPRVSGEAGQYVTVSFPVIAK